MPCAHRVMDAQGLAFDNGIYRKLRCVVVAWAALYESTIPYVLDDCNGTR